MADTIISTYRVKPECEEEFIALLKGHWPLLKRLDLVEGEPSLLFHGYEEGRPMFVEVFTWKGREAVADAHAHPEVAAAWARMESMVESRGVRPDWTFRRFKRLVRD